MRLDRRHPFVVAAIVEHASWSASIPFGAWILAMRCSTTEKPSLREALPQSISEVNQSSA
jgi:hypothetical protein